MKDRFDLESEITSLYSSADDLKTVAEMILDSDMIYNKDRIWNTLWGLAEVMEAKVNKLEDTFCQVYQLNGYAPEEVKKSRKYFYGYVNAYNNKEAMTQEDWENYFDQLDKAQYEEEYGEGM
jgi:hypothetical protein